MTLGPCPALKISVPTCHRKEQSPFFLQLLGSELSGLWSSEGRWTLGTDNALYDQFIFPLVVVVVWSHPVLRGMEPGAPHAKQVIQPFEPACSHNHSCPCCLLPALLMLLKCSLFRAVSGKGLPMHPLRPSPPACALSQTLLPPASGFCGCLSCDQLAWLEHRAGTGHRAPPVPRQAGPIACIRGDGNWKASHGPEARAE